MVNKKYTPPNRTKTPTQPLAPTRLGPGRLARSTTVRSAWEQPLRELKAFNKKHGHCNVPKKHPTHGSLGRWVSYVRRQKRIGAIAPELACRLDELGFTWSLRHRTVYRWDWDAMIAALTAFKKQHGHCRATIQPKKHPELARWLTEVRRRKRMGYLDPQRTRQLDKLGVVWQPNSKKWEAMFADLVKYQAKHGDCNPSPSWSKNPRLAPWVRWQRRRYQANSITQEHFDRLDKIGFEWHRGENIWESRYAELVEFKKTHGHCRVSTLSKTHASLGMWVRTMRGLRRKGKLSDERIQILNRLGFVWNGRKDRATLD